MSSEDDAILISQSIGQAAKELGWDWGVMWKDFLDRLDRQNEALEQAADMLVDIREMLRLILKEMENQR